MEHGDEIIDVSNDLTSKAIYMTFVGGKKAVVFHFTSMECTKDGVYLKRNNGKKVFFKFATSHLTPHAQDQVYVPF